MQYYLKLSYNDMYSTGQAPVCHWKSLLQG